jgi:hypothetical protein
MGDKHRAAKGRGIEGDLGIHLAGMADKGHLELTQRLSAAGSIKRRVMVG